MRIRTSAAQAQQRRAAQTRSARISHLSPALRYEGEVWGKSRLIAAAALIAIVTAVAAFFGVSPSPPPSSDSSSSSSRPSRAVSSVAQVAIVTEHERQLLQERGSRYRYITVRDSVHPQAARVMEQNPRTDLLVYKNASWVVREERGCEWAPYQGSGVSWCDVEDQMLLHSRSGEPLTSSGYDYQRALNVASPSYRALFERSVMARLRDTGWSGVFLDDVNLYPGHGIEGQIRELTDAAYRRETVEFISQFARVAHREGYTVAVNVGIDPWDPAQLKALRRLARSVDLVNREYFIRYGDGLSPIEPFTHPDAGGGSDWLREMRMMRAAQRAGAGYQGMVYGRPGSADHRIQNYARASFLMFYRPPSALVFRPSGAGETYKGPWTKHIGRPASQARQIGAGWIRRYSGGVAVVNPSPRGSQRFKLPGRYRRAGQCVRSIKLRAASGAVLRRC